MYTQDSAWFAFAGKEPGLLKVGKLADLAVLPKDYFKVPVEEIGEIEAVMTGWAGRLGTLRSCSRSPSRNNIVLTEVGRAKLRK